MASPSSSNVRMEPPPNAVYAQLDELVSVANAHAVTHGYKLVVVRSKTNAQGQKTWVHLACDRHGIKRNTHNLTDETRKKNRRSRRCECPMFCVASKTQSGLWELSIRSPEHNHGPYEPPPKKKKDFCLVPIGTASPSVSAEIAEVQRLLKRSGLHFTLSAGGTSIEGSWDDVTRIIGQAHSLLHGSGIVRVHTDIRIGSRTDKKQSVTDKVDAVRTLLSKDDHAPQVLAGNDHHAERLDNDDHNAAQHAVTQHINHMAGINHANHAIAPNLDRIVAPSLAHHPHPHPQLHSMNGHHHQHQPHPQHHPMMMHSTMHMQ